MLSILRWVENGCAIVAGATMALIMVLVSADALGRYFLNSPMEIQFELTQNHLLVAAIVLAYPWGIREGAHVRVEFLQKNFPEWLQRSVASSSLLAVAAIFAGVTYFSFADFVDAWRTNRVTMGVIDWPVVYSRIWVPLGAALVTLRLLAMAVMSLAPSVRVAKIYGDEITDDVESRITPDQ